VLNGKISTALRSDVGRVRGNNEDSVAEDADIGLLVLADGMGGHNAGEIASGIATATMMEVARREWPRLNKGQIDAASGYSVESLLLRQTLESAHSAIYQAAQNQPQYAGMGTTVVACLLRDDGMSIAYAGDSRLYRLRAGELKQITQDHSLLEEAVAQGLYSREDAGRRLRRNVLTRALGVEPTVKVDLIEEDLHCGDVVLLCSDGLTDMVGDEGIRLILMQFADPLDAAAEALVREANERGGKDNISVALARIDAAAPRARLWYKRLIEWL
jgi:protein phosphatase